MSKQTTAISAAQDKKTSLPDDYQNVVNFYNEAVQFRREALGIANQMQTTANQLQAIAKAQQSSNLNHSYVTNLRTHWDWSTYIDVSHFVHFNSGTILNLMAQFAGHKAEYNAAKVRAHNAEKSAERAVEILNGGGLAKVSAVDAAKKAYDAATDKDDALKELNKVKANAFKTTQHQVFSKDRHLPDPDKMIKPDPFSR